MMLEVVESWYCKRRLNGISKEEGRFLKNTREYLRGMIA
jgi:hypothetical protein